MIESENKNHKLAFIATGGGTSCAYSAGVAWALEEMGIKPDILIGSSGSAGTLSYAICNRAKYAANQLWIEETTADALVKKGIRPYFDVDFLVNGMRDKFPFNTKFDQLPAELYLATTQKDNGKLNYFSSRDPNLNWYEVIRASMAIPFFYNKTININGIEYIDGDLSADVQDHISLAKEKGADTIICCETNRQIPIDLIPYLGLALFNKFIRRAFKNYLKKKLTHFKLPTDVKIIHIFPKIKLTTKTLNNSKEAVRATVEAGYRDTKENLNLYEFKTN